MFKIIKLKNKSSSYILGISLALLIGALIFLFGLIINYIDESKYIERSTYLEAQMKTTTSLSNKILERYNTYAVTCANILNSDSPNGDDVSEYLDSHYDSFFLDNADIILVDDCLNFYGKDSAKGRISSPDYYGENTKDSVIYIGQYAADDDDDVLVFRRRLSEPVTATFEGRQISICYCAVIYYMDAFEREINAAFPFEGNRFIIDNDGFMLYKNFELDLLINGSNVFSKFEDVNLLHDATTARTIGLIRARKQTISEFELNDRNYFICTAPLAYNSWSLVFIIESDFLSSGQYISTIFRYALGIAGIFIVLVISIFVLIKTIEDNQNKLEYEKEINVKLEQATRAKSDFLSNMSHDIRTPINGIIGMTILAKKMDNPKKTDECLDNIEQASSHLLSLINDVLDMSSIESGKLQLVKKPVNILSIADDCATIAQGQIANRELELVRDFCEPFSLVDGDSLRIKQILINILSNAVKYTLDGGKIVFKVDLLEEDENTCKVQFKISDNGVGMKPEFIKRIWDAFSQEDGGSRTTYVGTGLGMAITKKCVDLMGGDISVESELYKGSTFTVTIPFDKAEGDVNSNTAVTYHSIDGVKILLAEDNELNMIVASELLSDEGAIVTKACNGREAVEAFSNSAPGDFDIIIMDIMMPEMNGLEATSAIRKLDRPDAATIPIVAMTANAFESDIKLSLEAGMNAHLSKPIQLKEVLSTISKFYNKEGL